MGIGGIGHLAEAEVDALGQENVQEADPVLARRSGSQVYEGVREANLGIDLHQKIGDARLREALVEIEDQFVYAFRSLGGKPVDVQATVTDDAAGDRSGPSSLGESLQAECHPCLLVGEPHTDVERHGQCGINRAGWQRDQCLCRVTVTPGSRQPEVAGAEAVAQMRQDGDFPEPLVASGLRIEIPMPLGGWTQEGSRGVVAAAVADQTGGIHQRLCNRDGLDIEGPQHAWSVAPKASVSLRHVGEWVVRHRVGQALGHGHQALKPVPAKLARYRLLKHDWLMPGLEQCLPEIGEGPEGTADGCPGVMDAGVTDPFSLSPGPADDTVMGLDEGIGETGLPFHGTYRQDGQAPVVQHLAQAVGEVSFPLPSQAGYAVGGYVFEDLFGETEALQELQAFQKASGDGGIVAGFELP